MILLELTLFGRTFAVIEITRPGDIARLSLALRELIETPSTKRSKTTQSKKEKEKEIEEKEGEKENTRHERRCRKTNENKVDQGCHQPFTGRKCPCTPVDKCNTAAYCGCDWLHVCIVKYLPLY